MRFELVPGWGVVSAGLPGASQKIARARVPDPDRPSRKNVAPCWRGPETERISTALVKPPCPVRFDRQIRVPRRTWQGAKCPPTDIAAYFPVTRVRPGWACSAAAVGNGYGHGRTAGGRVASISSSVRGTTPGPQLAH